ncbi:MAG: SDR family oxidoreductase [Bacteroidales bacterium]|nr:SDR family oxidoreductase [Bacteroidales bacterium]
MNILVTGASGMLGATIVNFLAKDFNVFATGRSEYSDCPVPFKSFDLLENDYSELILWCNPDIIVHSGALTNGNYCDMNPSEAFNTNGVSIKKFINATSENVKIIYISTDAVFSTNNHKAKEKECTNPESVYGKSKEIGEFFLINSSRKYTIIRTTIVGLNKNKYRSGFVEWIINSSIENKNIELFDDVVFCPITIWDLSQELKFLIQTQSEISDIIHIANNEYCTKYDFGINLLTTLGLDTKNIKKSSIEEFPNRVNRAKDQTLNTTYYQTRYNRKLPSIKDTINTIKEKYNEKENQARQ